MRILDRHLIASVVRFAVLALLSVVVIYLLIDLFEELNYFLTRKVSLPVVLLFYAYSLPAAITLLFPVSLLLAVFVVYGQMVRHRELHAIESAGVRAVRLFAPAVAVGLATVPVYLLGNEFITIRSNAALADLRSHRIERRVVQTTQKRRDVFYVGESGRVYNIREYEYDPTGTTTGDGSPTGIMSGFSVQELDAQRRVKRRMDGVTARYEQGRWIGYGVHRREFEPDGGERLVVADTMELAGIVEKPADFVRIARPVQESSTPELRRHIARMKRAGEDASSEEVEYHYRFSYALIGLIVVLLGLPLSVRLRRGGVMFGLGLGLLVSFLYWGAIQLSRAYGTSHIISPMMAAWIPNIVFGVIAVGLIANHRQ